MSELVLLAHCRRSVTQLLRSGIPGGDFQAMERRILSLVNDSLDQRLSIFQAHEEKLISMLGEAFKARTERVDSVASIPSSVADFDGLSLTRGRRAVRVKEGSVEEGFLELLEMFNLSLRGFLRGTSLTLR